jgi:hypothetical protein
MIAGVYPVNWYAGWILLLAAFISGSVIGLFFHNESWWGGYASFRRRIVRLGHISLAALGMVNLLFAATVPVVNSKQKIASILLVVGAVSMAGTCFLSGWKKSLRHLFVIPVVSLVVAVILILLGGLP